MSRRHDALCLAAAAIVLSLTGAPAPAQTIFGWNNTAGGTFSTATNWSPNGGPPGTNDTAQFGLNNTFTVTFTNSPTNKVLNANLGTLTFVASGAPQTYVLTTANVADSLTLGAASSPALTLSGSALNVTTGTLAVTNGSAASATTLAVGTTAADGTLTVDGTNSSLAVSSVVTSASLVRGSITFTNAAVGSFAGLGIGGVGANNSTASVSLLSGAHVTATGGVGVGTVGGATQRAFLDVSGTGASFTQSGATTLGVGSASSSPGVLNVTGGGTYTTGTGQTTVSATGSVNVSGGTFNANGNLLLDGGSLTLTNGSISHASGTTVTIQNGGSFSQFAGNYNAPANGTVTVTGAGSNFTSANLTFVNGGAQLTVSGGAAASTSITSVGTTGTGTVSVSGSGSSLTAAGVFVGSAAGSNGSLILDGATASFGSLNLGGNSAAGTGSATVQNGATLSVASSVSLAGAPGATGTLTATGVGSAVTQSGASSLSVGAFTNFGSGTLTLSGGANYTTGTGSLFVGNNGQITVTSSTFRANSATLDVFGILQAASGSFQTATGSVFNVDSGGQVTLGFFDPPANSTLTLNAGGQMTVAGTAPGAGSQVTVNAGGQLTVTGFLALNPNAAVTLNGGTLRLGNFSPNGGTVTFNSGTVAFTTSAPLDSPTLGTLLGLGNALTAGRTLTVTSLAQLTAPLNLNGGTFRTGSLTGGQFLALNTGTFNLTASTLSVGTGGQLGNTLSIGNGLAVLIDSSVTISSDGLVLVSGGQFATGANTSTNGGEIALSSDVSRVSGGPLTNNGTLRGTGRVDNALTNASAGQVAVAAVQRLVLGSTVSNAGVVSVIGGELQALGAVTNSPNTGLITGHDATLRFNGGLTNNGSLAFTAGQSDVFGTITSTRNVSSSDKSRITVSGGGTATFYGDVTVLAGQTDVQATAVGGTVSKVVFFGSYNGGVTGGGTAFIEGDHRPGASPALVRFDGDLAYGSGARLQVELGGTARGSQYDAVDVAGVASLAGTVDVSLINGFQPAAGQQFTVMTFASRSGDFTTYSNLNLGNGLQLTPTFTPTSLVLTVSPVPEPALALLIATTAGSAGVWWRRAWRRSTPP